MKKRKDIENNLWAEDDFPNNFKIGFKKKDKIIIELLLDIRELLQKK